MKVLIVDDGAVIRRTLEQLLRRNGYTVAIADCGVAALEMLNRDHTIEAVLTDYHMPDIDGIELFKLSRRIERLTDGGSAPPPSFVLLTADRDQTPLQLAMSLGFLQVMTKPPDYNRLLSQLAAVESDAQSRSQVATVADATDETPTNGSLLPGETASLSADVVGAIQTLHESIESLLAAEDIEALTRLHDAMSPDFVRLFRKIRAAEKVSG